MMKKVLILLVMVSGSTLALPQPKVIPDGECSIGTGSKYANGKNAPVCGVTREQVQDYQQKMKCDQYGEQAYQYSLRGINVPESLVNKLEYCKKYFSK